MHVPDGFLDAPTLLATAAVAAVGVSSALRGAKPRARRSHRPLAGLVAAFVFAAQMLNFPVGAGTSGHLLGGALAAVLVGAVDRHLSLSVVLLVQGLLFADGGLTALGTNITLMGLVGVWSGWLVFRAVQTVLPKRVRWCPSAAIAAIASVPVTARLRRAVCRWGPGPGAARLPGDRDARMARTHRPRRGAITGIAVRRWWRCGQTSSTEPEGSSPSGSRRPGHGGGMKREHPHPVVAGLAVTLLLAGFVSSFYRLEPPPTASSPLPTRWGSARRPGARRQRFAVRRLRHAGRLERAPLERRCGVAGVLVVALVGGGLAWALRRRSPPTPTPTQETEAEREQSSVTR